MELSDYQHIANKSYPKAHSSHLGKDHGFVSYNGIETGLTNVQALGTQTFIPMTAAPSQGN